MIRIALAQHDFLVGDIKGNLGKSIGLVDAAKAAGADLLLFPELALTGYPPEDLLLRPGFLEACHEAGLVTQPASAQNPGGMCNCCGDCCGSLAAMNKHPKPGTLVLSNYVAALDIDECSGCETCVERCPMEAISLNQDQVADINVANFLRVDGGASFVSKLAVDFVA